MLLRRRAVAWPLFAVAGACIVYCAAWIAAAFIVQDQAARWVERQRADGLLIAHGDPLLGGFPGLVIAIYPGWEMSAPITHGGWTWRTAAVRLKARPWSPLTFTVDLAGRHTLAGAWTPPGVAAWIMAAQADIKPVLTTEARVAEISLALKDLTIAERADAAPVFSLARGNFRVAKSPPEPEQENPIWRLELDAARVGLANGAKLGPFASRLEAARLVADLVGPVTAGPLPTAVEAWRRAGGTIEVRDFFLEWAPLSVSASGTLSVDERLQPIGAVTAKFRGFFETVDALTTQGLVRSTQASMAKVMLGLLARTPEGGGAPELNLAVTLQDRKLYTGPVALMDMPEIEWPAQLMVPEP
ncbi:MAG: DUF2125 domain-containing protein [Rhodospirillaceae bacterium]|nr:DUF2125 domain-containing protein [Rhodospirillaceae bacterium]